MLLSEGGADHPVGQAHPHLWAAQQDSVPQQRSQWFIQLVDSFSTKQQEEVMFKQVLELQEMINATLHLNTQHRQPQYITLVMEGNSDSQEGADLNKNYMVNCMLLVSFP